ncbi:uncharacterized protein LOC106129514 [Amyelois transitella]|uniref:uncharacterized protein LOC106129514 n=1 Tax=Amyelois transitella TaxID=680683 RepID=UPI00067B553A|nr:uncharacterized protein LOC106129514 [Amyelois transitella]
MNTKVENLDSNSLVEILKNADLHEFVEFVLEKGIDGRKLLDVTEGLVKVWAPKANAKKFMLLVEDLKLNPDKYVDKEKSQEKLTDDDKKVVEIPIECQYQTVPSKRLREEQRAATSMSSIEDILKRLVPAKSFLYRNQQRVTEKSVPSYLPMDGGKKTRKLFRLSYEYPDIFSRFSKHETFDDRGYYSVKTNRFSMQKTYKRQEYRTKYKSLSTTEEIDKFPDDHFYEDLCYNDVNKNDDNMENIDTPSQVYHVKSGLVKIQELFQSFRMPFFKKLESVEEELTTNCGDKTEKQKKETETNLYENSDSVVNMYDSVRVIPTSVDANLFETINTKLPVEDYLEPVQLNKDYCSVVDKVEKREDSLLGYIRSMFETRFGLRRETHDSPSEDSEDEKPNKGSPPPNRSDERPRHMADRPLPVPVENEPYYMNIDRGEAENLLLGHPDGTFVLRPSSQSTHAYTLSVCCANKVHNVGVRRRPDGRLALGFPRRGERSFMSVTSLLRHHKRRRLLLVAGGGVIGATTLNEPPQYYQMPSSLPVL